ncbi:transposase family protein, partial [Actinomadura geliboluensis]
MGRYRRQGWDGPADRRSGPRTSPSKTAARTEERVLAARLELRPGPDHIAAATGVPARTVTRILRRHRVPVPAARAPVTGHQNRATRHSGRRYEHPEPGAMIHLDVKKLGRIPDGGARRAHGRSEAVCGRGIGYDHVHTAIDDHTHPAYAEVLPDDKGTTCAAFPTRAAASFTAHGITRIHRVPTDNPRNHRHPAAFQQACTELGARQKFTRPRYPNPAVRGPTEKPNAST